MYNKLIEDIQRDSEDSDNISKIIEILSEIGRIPISKIIEINEVIDELSVRGYETIISNDKDFLQLIRNNRNELINYIETYSIPNTYDFEILSYNDLKKIRDEIINE